MMTEDNALNLEALLAPGLEADAASTAEAPELATELSEQAMKKANARPEMAPPPVGTVELPGGWFDAEGALHTTAQVRELTGRDEERLARIDAVANLPLFLQTMCECGLEAIGPHKSSPAMTNSLLTGDREAIILGIRIATYGDSLPMHIACPICGAEEDLELELSKDIPVKKMEQPKIRHYDVKLRDGRVAVLTPVTTAMQDAIWDIKKNAAEMKTATLERCVVSIDGEPVQRADILELGLADRKKLLQQLIEIQPGPDYSGIALPCESCGREFALSLDLNDLFQ